MKENKKKRSWKRVVSILSGVVVFCTTYALILPAVTMSKETYCGKEAHVHTEACYRSQTPLCGKEEGEPNEGHVHDETCYEEVRNLICGLEESETHTHTDECYETTTTQTCGKEESEPSEGHTHSDECYKSEELQCGKEEHEHTRICESNKEDVEDPADWDETYKELANEEDAKTRILTVVKNELGTKENKNNFEIDEEEKEHYYTRYGHLYEDMYGDWNNYFTGYVLKYANVQMSYDKDASKWQNKTIHDQKEEGEEGNVVFFRNDEGELRTGIVTSIDDLKKEIRVIEGDVEGEVKEERVNKDKVIAYLNDQIEIIEEDTPLAGEELEKEEEINPNEKSVDVDGKDQTVQVGDQITLTAQTEGFDEGQTLSYQWQYNASEDCADDAWENLEGETNQQIVLDVTEENIDYFWRVEVLEKNDSEMIGGVPDYGLGKLKNSLSFSWFENELMSEDSNDNEQTESMTVSTKFQLKTEARGNSIDWNNLSTTSEDKIVVKKIWEKKTPKDAMLKVQLRLFEGEKTAENWDSELNRPIFDEDEIDNNPIIHEFDLTLNNQWKAEISLQDVLNNEKINNDDSKLANFYITESGNDDLLQNYTGWYSTPEKETVEGKNKLVFANTLEDGKKYVILDNDSKYIYDKNSEHKCSLFNENSIQNSQIWIAKKNQEGTWTFTNNEGQNLTEKKLSYEQPNLYYKNENENYYLRFKDNKFKFKDGSLAKKTIKVYEIVQQPASSIYTYTVTNSLIGSGTYGDGELQVKPEEIIHSKTIDYLGDGEANKDVTYPQGTNLSDKYRLYLDAGPIAGDKPVDLVLVLDNSSSMGDDSSNSSRLHQLKDVLIGTQRDGSSGLVHDFFEMNSGNTITVTEFDRASELKCYKISKEYKQEAITEIQSISKGSGTNYQAALHLAETQLKNLEKENLDTQKYMIFLSDGEPWGYGIDSYHGTGIYSSSYDTAFNTIEAINSIHSNFPDTPISIIDFKDGGTVFLKEGSYSFSVEGKIVSGTGLPQNGGKYCSSRDQTQLKNDLRLLAIGPRCTQASITDTLTDYVDFDWENIDLLVKAVHNSDSTKDRKLVDVKTLNAENMPQTINPIPGNLDNGDTDNNSDNSFYADGNTKKEWDIQKIVQNVTINGKTITLNFNPNWELDPTYRYEISFNVKPTQTAYDELATNGQYPHIGSQKSDYLTNITSTGQKGFYSNASSNLTYKYNNTVYSTLGESGTTKINAYQRPVVQVNVSKMKIHKVDSKSTTGLAGATFEIWKVGAGNDVIEGTDGEKGKHIGTVTTADNGYIDVDKLSINRTYYLKEVKAPNGYHLLNSLIKLEIKPDGIYATISPKDGGTGKSVKLDSDENKIAILEIKNTAGQALPNTGGAGTQLFTFSGGAIIAASSLMYGYKKRSKRNKTGKGGK